MNDKEVNALKTGKITNSVHPNRRDNTYKVIDFRDSLMAPEDSEFTQVFGKHAGIRVTLTDTAGEKPTVFYHAGVDSIFDWADRVESIAQKELDADMSAAGMLADIYKGLKPWPEAQDAVKAQVATLGKRLKQAVPETTLIDYNASTRVQVAKADMDGYCPVRQISVRYQPVRSNGEVAKMPWMVSINNFEAKKKDDGVTYISSTKRNDKAVTITLTTDELRHMLRRCVQYIEQWRLANTAQATRGLKLRREAYQEG